MEEKKPQGVLFDRIAYYNQNQVSELIENMSFEQSFFYITQALEYCHESGLFSLTESEIVSRATRILSSKLSEAK